MDARDAGHKAQHQRLFIGLSLPASYQEGLEAVRREWEPEVRSRVSWTRGGNWHLTLAFLGELPATQAEAVQQALGNVRFPEFALRAAGGGGFPPGKRPRVLWIGLQEGAQESLALAEQIWSVLQPLGFEAPKRPFRAHLTLMRVKQDRGDDWTPLLRSLGNRQWPRCQQNAFVLWQSELTPRGPVYTVRQRYPLVPAPEGTV
ncbi:MAG: RNA 2',3'-cyclic phosphodiesterase [Desulfohalobium sp.]